MPDEEGSLAQVVLTPEAEHEWVLLRELVDFADRLVLAFVFADRFPVRVLRARLEQDAGAAGMPFRVVIADDPEELQDHALGAVLAPQAEHEVVWFEAFGSEDWLRDSWFFAAQRWNEHREPLRRSSLRALIVAAPSWAKPVIRLAAPDLWSITNLVIEPRALPIEAEFELSSAEPSPETTPAEQELAAWTVERALSLPEGDERIWSLLSALDEAIQAGAWHAADRVAQSPDLSAARLAGLGDLAGPLWEDDLAEMALLLLRIGAYFGQRNRVEQALAAGQRAVELLQKLERQRPGKFKAEQALSLIHLGNSLEQAGRSREALAMAQEAVRLLEGSTLQTSGYLEGLAASAQKLSLRLRGSGRQAEALNAARRVVRLYRTLAQERPEEFLPKLAMSLTHLASRLSDVGQPEEALAAAIEAVKLNRDLAAKNPARFQQGLAASLLFLSLKLSRVGRREGALAAAEEAVRAILDKPRSSPSLVSAELEPYVRNLAERLGDNQRDPDTNAVFREAKQVIGPADSARGA